MNPLQHPIHITDNGWSHQDLKATGQVILDGPGTLESYEFFNGDSAINTVLMFDAAAAGDVTLGTTIPKRQHGLAANGGWISKTIPTFWPTGCVVFAIAGTDSTTNTGATTKTVSGNALKSSRRA